MYRTIELVDGWDGRIISNELYFNVMDGAMIVAAMYCLNFFNPGRLLGPGVPATEMSSFESMTDSREKTKFHAETYNV